jgi:hypothetical protein
LEGLSLHIYLLLKLGEFLKEGTLVLRDTESWKVISIATVEESLLMSLLFPNPHICSIFQEFGGQNKKG